MAEINADLVSMSEIHPTRLTCSICRIHNSFELDHFYSDFVCRRKLEIQCWNRLLRSCRSRRENLFPKWTAKAFRRKEAIGKGQHRRSDEGKLWVLSLKLADFARYFCFFHRFFVNFYIEFQSLQPLMQLQFGSASRKKHKAASTFLKKTFDMLCVPLPLLPGLRQWILNQMGKKWNRLPDPRRGKVREGSPAPVLSP